MTGANRRFNPPPPQPTPDLHGGSLDSGSRRAINSYLSSQSFPISLPPKQVPSVKDITEIIKFLMSKLDYPSTPKFEDDLFIIVKSLNCPFKFNKSTLRSPNSPHNWPTYLALINWMVQIASYTNPLLSNSGAILENNCIYKHARDSYLKFIESEDDAVAVLDREFIGKIEKERDIASQNVKELAEKVNQLESLQTSPTEIEKLEKEKSKLEEDVNKLNAMIAGFDERVRKLEELLEDKDKALKVKLEEHKRICFENDELKKEVESQTFNARDFKRMKKELQAVEREIEDAETGRSAWEEKCWDLDATLSHKFKELEAISIQSNQAIKRLKFSNDIRYVLIAEGSTPAEILGIDHEATLKPTLESFADKINKSCMEKLEELISLLQESSEMAAKVEGQRNRIAALQSFIDEVEAKLSLLRKEMREHTYRCAAEVKKMMEDVEIDAHQLGMVESEAAEALKAAEVKLQESVRQIEEETQIRASELWAIADSVSKHRLLGVKNLRDEEHSLRNCSNRLRSLCQHNLTKYTDVLSMSITNR